jgi:Sec-independent protein translocase protein TatA
VPLNLSFTHLAVVGIVALVVLGPERLPGVARTAGNLYREWQRIRGGLEGEVREAINEFKEPFMEQFEELGHTVRGTTPGRAAPDQAPPLSVLPPLAGAAGAVDAGPLSPALPSLGPSTGLVSPGPVISAELPVLAPPPIPDTFVAFYPGSPA